MRHCQVTSLWVYGDIPDYVRLCINSFLAHGHTYALFTYGSVNMPGVTVRDAREILPEDAIWRDTATGSLAPFSDLFRWAWLKKEGGSWVDADIVCLKDCIPASDDIYLCYEDETKRFIGASCVKLPKDHPIAKDMYTLSYDPLTRLPWEDTTAYNYKQKFFSFAPSSAARKIRQQNMPWSYSSTLGVTHSVRHHRLQQFVHPSTDIYPIHWKQAITLYNGEATLDQCNNSWAIHLWGHELRKNSLFLHVDSNSIMQALMQQYGI